ncbi:transketolase family protein [Chromobacterium haemolyticum]|uniref:transketolase family protein n=1 Tax=Chromobacterium haemolyticum TaxID=394935 RepID=UPI0005849CCD|nr:transketolase C-terminal domain-containing protein [Chromobacterium haemolyticum]
MRNAFSSSLLQLAESDKRVLLLTGDHGYALFDDFRSRCPQQYINAGIAEQNMIGMAAGLSKAGYIPVVYGLSSFVPIRVLEQIKLDLSHDNLHAIIIGDGAGFVYSHLGTSHQSTEDIAATRAIPNLNIYSPSDRHELTLCMEHAYKSKATTYLRIGKSDLGDVHHAPLSGTLASFFPVRNGTPGDISFIATGAMTKMALKIAESFFPNATVWSAPKIKPLDVDQLVTICKSSNIIVTFEEHSTQGGLGSMIAEISTTYAPIKILRVGVEDCFTKLCGSYSYLLQEQGLDITSIQKKITTFLKSPPQ